MSLKYLVIVTVAVADILSMSRCGPPSGKHTPTERPDSGTHAENGIPAAAVAILEQADVFELLSLSPRHQPRTAKDDFHGYEVLGRAEIADPKTRKKLVSAFEQGVAENQGTIAACFNPRHGIHVTRNGKTEDFVVCFECLQVHSYGAIDEDFLISSSPNATFETVLRRAGILLAHE